MDGDKAQSIAGAGRGLAVWAVAWAAMLALDGRLDLANLALLLALAAALAALSGVRLRRLPLDLSTLPRPT